MSVRHVNRKGQTFYLHQGTTKTVKPKYFFSMKSEGDLAAETPDGYEIFENVNALVFLRKIQPKLISNEEKAVVEEELSRSRLSGAYRIEIKASAIVIHEANQDIEDLKELFRFSPVGWNRNAEVLIQGSLTFTPMMRFVLVDETDRLFTAQRYCFRGEIDDWIELGRPDRLPKLAREFVKHLGRESFFELF